jgi:hypothetical protein
MKEEINKNEERKRRDINMNLILRKDLQKEINNLSLEVNFLRKRENILQIVEMYLPERIKLIEEKFPYERMVVYELEKISKMINKAGEVEEE